LLSPLDDSYNTGLQLSKQGHLKSRARDCSGSGGISALTQTCFCDSYSPFRDLQAPLNSVTPAHHSTHAHQIFSPLCSLSKLQIGLYYHLVHQFCVQYNDQIM